MKNTRVLNSANILLICNISCCISSFLSLLNFSNCSLCVAFDWASSSLWIAFEWASCSLINSSTVSNSVTLWVVSLDNGGVKVYYERFDPLPSYGVHPKPTPHTCPLHCGSITLSNASSFDHRIPPLLYPCSGMPSSFRISFILACFPKRTK